MVIFHSYVSLPEGRVGDRIPCFWKSARWIFVPLWDDSRVVSETKISGATVLFLMNLKTWGWRHTLWLFSSGNALDPVAMCTLLASTTACDFNFGFMFLLMCEHLWQAYFELFWWMGQVQRSKHTVKVFVDLSRFRRRNRQKHGDRQATF